MKLLDLNIFDDEIKKLTSILKTKFNIIPKFGVEIEFYLKHKTDKLSKNEIIEDFKNDVQKYDLTVSEEKGLDQFEIQLEPSTNSLMLINKIKKVKLNLQKIANKHDLKIIFRPKPFLGTYGSSMHFHLSLYNDKDHNVFSDDTINTNMFLNNVTNSILLILNQSLYLICGDNFEEYSRFTPNFMAPVNISWGSNNRTTAVRIPDSDINSRRLEFRIPSASCDPQKIIFFLLVAVLDAQKNPKATIDRAYGNAADSQYKFNELFNSPSIAKENYSLDTIYSKILSK